MRRIETVVAKVQSANATIAGRLVAQEHVERTWFQATRAVTEASVAKISSVTADMRRENENFRAKVNEGRGESQNPNYHISKPKHPTSQGSACGCACAGGVRTV
eukprot:78475-Prymnesium_polylepis.1